MSYRVSLSQRSRALLVATCLATLGASAGCGLIVGDATTIDLTVPDKMYTVDASGWQVDPSDIVSYFAQSCAQAPTVCAVAAQTACSDATCAGTCGANSECELALQISLWRTVDLVSETPDVKTVKDMPSLNVTIDSVTYEVADNSLNIDTPALTIYVAPSSVMSAGATAKPIGTIASIPAGSTTSGPLTVDFTDTGKADLSAAMSSYQTPFNVLVGSSLTLAAGDEVPTGKLDAVVHIDAHGSL